MQGIATTIIAGNPRRSGRTLCDQTTGDAGIATTIIAGNPRRSGRTLCDQTTGDAGIATTIIAGNPRRSGRTLCDPDPRAMQASPLRLSPGTHAVVAHPVRPNTHPREAPSVVVVRLKT